MSDSENILVLSLNAGSSSLKFSLFTFTQGSETLMFSGKMTRIGLENGRCQVANAQGRLIVDQYVGKRLHPAALDLLMSQILALPIGSINVVGHRVVQGGPHHVRPERVTNSLIAELTKLTHLDPLHMPAALAGMDAARRLGPNVVHVACFDTAFHRTLPPLAQQLPFSPELAGDPAFLRYGFHGLSYEYLLSEVRLGFGPKIAQGKIIMAHLGNGASMTALNHGRS